MSAPALRLVPPPRSALAESIAAAFRRLDAALRPDAPRCSCGRALATKPCACCGARVPDCPACPRTVWRGGVRVVSLTRCDACAKAGCSYRDDSRTHVIRCRPDLPEFVVHDDEHGGAA